MNTARAGRSGRRKNSSDVMVSASPGTPSARGREPVATTKRFACTVCSLTRTASAATKAPSPRSRVMSRRANERAKSSLTPSTKPSFRAMSARQSSVAGPTTTPCSPRPAHRLHRLRRSDQDLLRHAHPRRGRVPQASRRSSTDTHIPTPSRAPAAPELRAPITNRSSSSCMVLALRCYARHPRRCVAPRGGYTAAEDLSGARIAAMPPVDGLFSNLRTGVLYALSTNGLSAFQFIVGPSGPSFTSATFTHILELDRDRLTPTGVIITLSRSVTMTGGATIYAGYDRIVLASNAGSFDVALPGAPASPGSVTDLGVSAPPRRGCENWAAWGIAEFYGGAIWLARASSTSADIVRTRVPDGLTETVARFSNVGDLCGFTVVPSRGRWYFHHEGNSQFAMGLAEVIGYADATFVFSD